MVSGRAGARFVSSRAGYRPGSGACVLVSCTPGCGRSRIPPSHTHAVVAGRPETDTWLCVPPLGWVRYRKRRGRNTNQPCGWLVFLPLRVVLSCCVVWCRRLLTLPHPGGCSTISVGRLSFRVRNGYRALPCHYHHRQTYKGLSMSIFFVCVRTFGWCVRYCIVDAKPKWCDCDPTVLCGSFLFWLCLFGGLVPVTFTCYHASRSGLSTP